ncbi:hypothetical protein Ciccas_003545 [Cichlidogyrus casuarinus]|uniref:DH domain-containing protein n=1 Tax=Cichlidogyrus casuarinus TaxID=1844966 RepID=A0ABD2QE39_9PLAT
MDHLSQRAQLCISELIDTEAAYVTNIRQVVQSYTTVLSKAGTFAEKTLDKIFGNIVDLLHFHTCVPFPTINPTSKQGVTVRSRGGQSTMASGTRMSKQNGPKAVPKRIPFVPGTADPTLSAYIAGTVQVNSG